MKKPKVITAAEIQVILKLLSSSIQHVLNSKFKGILSCKTVMKSQIGITLEGHIKKNDFKKSKIL